jgi:large exoprotein involved in heme utilization and adhesion
MLSVIESFFGTARETPVANSQGDGGNITIDHVFVVLDGVSAIIATAKEGSGGNIDIRIIGGGDLFQSPDSVISASSELGVDGLVRIDSPETNIIQGISTLPVSYFDNSFLLSERCAFTKTKDLNSFVVVGRGGIPLGPDGSPLSEYGVRPHR